MNAKKENYMDFIVVKSRGHELVLWMGINPRKRRRARNNLIRPSRKYADAAKEVKLVVPTLPPTCTKPTQGGNPLAQHEQAQSEDVRVLVDCSDSRCSAL